jgi:hypothetical protein
MSKPYYFTVIWFLHLIPECIFFVPHRVIAVRSAVEMNNNIMNHSRTKTYYVTDLFSTHIINNLSEISKLRVLS